jgi:nucleoside 2-deoxyribosyltransferase
MSLTPSQRLSLLKVIAERLSNESWQFVDITLQQFGISTPESWSGLESDYIMRATQKAPDQKLIDLAQHVGHKFGQPTSPGVEPPFWRKDMLRLFVSHLAAERAYAGELQENLFRYGISSFVAHNDIEPTSEWQVQIETALATCDALVALLHDKFHASNWTDQEIGFAMGRGVPTFAVRLGETPYGFIGRFQAFNGNGKSAPNLASELFDCYRKHKQTESKMSAAVVSIFELSDSFATAKERMRYLEQLQVWDPSFAGRIRSAVNTNSQIDGSYGVPERVKKLLQKWAAAES